TEVDVAARPVAQLTDLIHAGRLRRRDVHDQLMRARNVFLAGQERQAFGPPPPRQLPELPTQVLDPLLAMTCRDAVRILDDMFGAFIGAASPPLISLDELIRWQLRPWR